MLQRLKQVQDTDSKFLSKSHEIRKKSIAQDKSKNRRAAKTTYATNSTKADAHRDKGTKKGKIKTKQNKTTGPGKLLHTFTNSHAADASAATTRAQNADNAELALQCHSHRPALTELGGTGNQVPP